MVCRKLIYTVHHSLSIQAFFRDNKLLYFTCPTDRLEPVINNAFKQENYFYSSLGNSTVFDDALLKHLKKMITTQKIKEISFVLSKDNRVVLDALGNQDYSDVTGLNNFYGKIKMHNENARAFWQTKCSQFLILSYHLNNKIKELEYSLNDLFIGELNINGKIYNRQRNIFSSIHSELFCSGYASFN